MKNENIYKLFEIKKGELEKAKKYLTKVFGSEERLELARKIFRLRYNLIGNRFYSEENASDPVQKQAVYTSNQCLKILFGKIEEEILWKLEAYDCLKSHVRVLKDYSNIDNAILVNDYTSTGEDNYERIAIASFTKLKGDVAYEYLMLIDSYCESDYIDSDYKPSEEKQKKINSYWKQNGYL